MKTRNVLKSGISLLLTCSMLVAALIIPGTAAKAQTPLTGETSRTTKEITLANGTKTGVKYSKITIGSGTYGYDLDVNMAEFSLSNTNLSVEVINSGSQIVDVQTVTGAISSYNSSHSGQTVLAAVNGDLWMTNVHSNSSVTTQTLRATRGVLIIDGEIWASQQIDQENLMATNNEKGTPCGNMTAFGVTRDNQPLVGSPDIQVSMKVVHNGKTRTISADGINRLPATNSVIVYNHRVNESNYALNDAHEVLLEVNGSSAFTATGTVTATVKAIYPAGSTSRPAIGANNIVITARGNRQTPIVNNFSVGDTVTFTTKIEDRMGRTDLWQNVTDAIGGHMEPLIDGKLAVSLGDNTRYPTSFIGYRDDGTVALVSVTNPGANRNALRFSQMYSFLKELGYNSVFLLDGGGSTTFASLENGTYTVRNTCSDGSPRSVINSVAVVWNNTPVCEKQGSLDYITIEPDLSAIPGYYLTGELLASRTSSPTNATIGYDEEVGAFHITTDRTTNDPYASLSMESFGRVNASEYPYIVLKVKNNHTSATNFVLYYGAGSSHGASEARKAIGSVKPGMDQWQYVIIDMSQDSNWSGNINDIRLDPFDSVNSPAGTSMYIAAVAFCKTSTEANKMKSGWVPDGAVTDYNAWLAVNYPELLPKDEVTEPEDTETEPTDVPTVTDPVDQPTVTDPVDQPAVTDPVTEPTPDVTQEPAETPAGTEAEKETKDMITPGGGCGAVVGTALPALLILAGAGTWVLRSKRKED